MCYHYFGKVGYWAVLISTIITLWGSDMGTMVIMTDYMAELPIFASISTSPYINRLIPTIILVILCWVLCILKNQSYVIVIVIVIVFRTCFQPHF